MKGNSWRWLSLHRSHTVYSTFRNDAALEVACLTNVSQLDAAAMNQCERTRSHTRAYFRAEKSDFKTVAKGISASTTGSKGIATARTKATRAPLAGGEARDKA